MIRGSSSRTGAQAMRDLYLAVSRHHISPANTPDGPRGPIFEFKPGPLMLAQMTGAPILPMACAAKRCKQLDSWDRFILPGWFNTLVVVIGEPVFVQKGLPMRWEAVIPMRAITPPYTSTGTRRCPGST